MNESYSIGDLIHDGDYYDYVNDSTGDLDFYKKWCRGAGGPVLELCSGTGRLTIPLKEAGIDVMGLDISTSMLEKARQKTAEKGLDIEFVQGDMRTFELARKFSLIFIPFNSLQCIYSLESVEHTFGRVKAHLRPRGLFVFDIFNPDFHLMMKCESGLSECRRFSKSDGTPVMIRERCKYDAAGQVNRVQWLYRIGDREIMQNLDIRCFYPLEMDALLKYNGFRILHKFGRFDESPFGSDSPKQIYACRPDDG
jgi:SAM-dependent methyltransferase